MRFFKLRRFVIRFFLIIFIFSFGYAVGSKKIILEKEGKPTITINREVPADKNVDFSLFWQVWDLVHQNYFDESKIDNSDLVYGSIKGMVSAIGDPYTTFLTPKENQVVKEDLQGNFEGVGIQIGFRGTQLVVVAPLAGSPAEKAGVKAGDFIIGIKDEARKIDKGTVGMSLPEAVESIRGPAGTSVTLALLREGVDNPILVNITRASINVPSVTLEFVGKDKNIAHINILKFGSDTVSEWNDKVIEILQKENLAGVIVDVRNNTGGYLQAAVDIASEFLDKEKVVVIEERGNGNRKEFKSDKIGRLRKEKVLVLVNKGSASASEILAAALRDNKKVQLIGETTFGKGTIQEPIDVNIGGSVHITVAKWLTPNGTWVNEKGLDPDVKIEDSPETPEDEQLNKAINIINSL